jgi:hypothetical protein
MKRDTKRKITVEDLLSLKKAERPPVEFWARFESEMRAKQLSAIVGKRSWRDGLPRIFAAFYRHQVPVGAFAALALTWATIHYSSEPLVAVRAVPVATAASRPAALVSIHSAPVVQLSEHMVQAPTQTLAAAPEAAPARVVAASLPRASEAPAAESADFPTRTQFSDMVAASLADFRQAQPELAKRDIFSSDREFETTVESMRQPAADPLTRVDPVSEERRARLLTTSLPAYASSSPASLASERVKERVSNDRMYESMDPYESSSRMSLEIKF